MRFVASSSNTNEVNLMWLSTRVLEIKSRFFIMYNFATRVTRRIIKRI